MAVDPSNSIVIRLISGKQGQPHTSRILYSESGKYPSSTLPPSIILSILFSDHILKGSTLTTVRPVFRPPRDRRSTTQPQHRARMAGSSTTERCRPLSARDSVAGKKWRGFVSVGSRVQARVTHLGVRWVSGSRSKSWRRGPDRG